jgi:hypothetical protein
MKEINNILDEVNKVSSSEADRVKQKFCLCFLENYVFKVLCDISCVRAGRHS